MINQERNRLGSKVRWDAGKKGRKDDGTNEPKSIV